MEKWKLLNTNAVASKHLYSETCKTSARSGLRSYLTDCNPNLSKPSRLAQFKIPARRNPPVRRAGRMKCGVIGRAVSICNPDTKRHQEQSGQWSAQIANSLRGMQLRWAVHNPAPEAVPTSSSYWAKLSQSGHCPGKTQTQVRQMR